MTDISNYHNALLIERYSLKMNLSLAQSENLFEQLKDFLYQCSISSKPLRPSKQIDDMWHEFILFTRDYYHFCKNYLGQFIHHIPKIPTTKSISKSLKFVGVCDGAGDCDTSSSSDGPDW